MNRVLKGCLIGCGVLALLVAVVAFGSYFWVQKTFFSPKPPDPKIGNSVALRPTFSLRKGNSFSAGTAVAVRLKPGAKPVLLTALHLFGPAGGLESDLAPPQLEKVVSWVLLTPVSGKQQVAAARGALRKKGTALTDSDPDVRNDVAAFGLVPGSKVNALDLAPANPAMGEWVWLVGDVVDHVPQTQRLFPARVMVSATGQAMIKFESDFQLQAFSGAPVINVKRQVAGILIGGGGGMGTINPAGSIRQRLAESGVPGA